MDAKTIYAQSSDIKSRTYLEYRKDMKKKAISELEILNWLRTKLATIYKAREIEVRKSGGDSFLWFLRKGGVTREPDYKAIIDGKDYEIEFQYADKEGLSFFDFAVSKISKKDRKTGKRIPHKDRIILYILKNNNSYAFLEPEWITKFGKIGFVSAWRKDAYRVPKDEFLKILHKDKDLSPVIESIDKKNFILNFQHKLIDTNKGDLSKLLQGVVDEKKIIRFVPNELDTFFKVCFILDNLNKIPENVNMWLIYLLSFISEDITSQDLFKIVYCMDFLYSKTELKAHEIKILTDKIKECFALLKKFEQSDGLFRSSNSIVPIRDIMNSLFAINLLEDLTQDLIYYYHIKELTPIKTIYQNLHFLDKTYQIIKTS